jgi:hypothetical protein
MPKTKGKRKVKRKKLSFGKLLKTIAGIVLPAIISGGTGAATSHVLQNYTPTPKPKSETVFVVREVEKRVPAETKPPEENCLRRLFHDNPEYEYSFHFGKNEKYNLSGKIYDPQTYKYVLDNISEFKAPSPEDAITLKYRLSPSEDIPVLDLSSKKIDDLLGYLDLEVDEASKKKLYELKEIIAKKK